MKNKLILNFFVFNLLTFLSFSQFSENYSPSYKELIKFYDSLSKNCKLEMYNMGNSDYGLPIYLCLLNGSGDSLSSFEKIKTSKNIFVNNAIHPGEPDGINACALLTLDYLNKKIKINSDFTFSFFIAYNVGGMMNRSSTSRANQNGPKEYGFRGSAKNLDLNRDFIKMDSENSFVFSKTFHILKPVLFIDTHVSNGADYSYILTYISSLKQKQTKAMNHFIDKYYISKISTELKNKNNIDLFPYVELKEHIPDGGIIVFNDLPRYSMGYASLFPCISITTETHMLKPFPLRVKATYSFILESINLLQKYSTELSKAIIENDIELKNKQKFFFNYELKEKADSIFFKGFKHEYIKSDVTNLPSLTYNNKINHHRYIPFFNNYYANDSLLIPKSYVVQYQCKEVINRIKANNIEFYTIKADTLMELITYKILNFNSINEPYEGHYYHDKVDIENKIEKILLKAGDIIIDVNSSNFNFLCSVLEPKAEDSYFRWNFFDSYLQEKEYFSDYVFEEKAKEILKLNPKLKEEFENLKKNDNKFAENNWEQLYFIYKNSPYFEPTYMKLPIYKIEK